MSESKPSNTAFGVAMLRAVHQLLDAEPKILDDPVVLRLMDAKTLEQIRSDSSRAQVPWVRGLRSHVVVRSRYAEDRLREAVRRGIRQYLILGAGYDTFAYRQPEWAQSLQIFEVDQPATQRGKRERLRHAGVTVPANLEYGAVDFESASLREGMQSSSFDFDRPAFVSCLGVLVYLTEAAAMEIFRFVARLPQSSEIVFTFSAPESALTASENAGRAALSAMVGSLGEQWRTHFDEGELTGKLREMGFGEIEVLTPEETERRYFHGRSDGLRVSKRSSVASAVVGKR